jgi:hypothetical protein
MITRLAGGAGATGAVEATNGSGAGELIGVGVELAANGCSIVDTGVGGNSTAAGGACGTLGATGVTLEAAGVAGFASCGPLFAGTATTVDAAVNPDDGGFTITGPCGAREAMAGVGVGVEDTIWGACRGKGTIFLGAGFEPVAALADIEPAGVATGVPTDAGLSEAGAAAEELAAGAETVGFAAPAATAVTVGRGGAAVTPRCIPCESRCSFCC